MPGERPQGIVDPEPQLDSKEDTMRTNQQDSARADHLADRGRGSSHRPRGSDLAAPRAEERSCTNRRHRRLDTPDQPRADPRRLPRTRALSVREGQERQERLRRMCATFWPPLIAGGKPRGRRRARRRRSSERRSAPTDGCRSRTTTTRSTRSSRTSKTGQTNGEVSAFGGQWNTVSPAGTKVARQAKPVQSGMPQNNGGDHDSDNNGGPSDGDGNI